MFVEKVDEMRATRAVTGGFKSGFSIKYDQHQGLKYELTQPDEEDIRSFLLTFRHFVAQNEPVFLGAIYNTCHRYVSNEIVKTDLVHSRRNWNSIFKRGGIELVWNDKPLRPETIFDLWINGHYFHSDENKRKFISTIPAFHGLFVRSLFLNFLTDGAREVIYVGGAVKYALKEGLLST